MRLPLLLLSLGLMAGPAPVPAQGIAEVLMHSQQQRLARFEAADPQGADARRVHASLERLNALLAGQGVPPTQLRLYQGGLFAEAQFGQPLVVAGLGVAELPEGERLMLLAHELGHLHLGHWQALRTLYEQHIPGTVSPDTTEPVAAALGRAAHALSHEQELAADAYGLALLRETGHGVEDACSLLLRQGLQADSATHPSTRKRLAQLRWLDAQAQAQAERRGPTLAAAPVATAPQR